MKQESHNSSSTLWLEDYVFQKTGNKYDIHEPHYQAITNFVLLWGLFESRFFGNNSSELRVWNYALTDSHADSETIHETFLFLRKRYVVKDMPNDQFYELGFSRVDSAGNKRYFKRLAELIDYLCNADTLTKENCACLALIWRFRNNLFHGNKNLAQIWNSDQELFEIACRYIIAQLDLQDQL